MSEARKKRRRGSPRYGICHDCGKKRLVSRRRICRDCAAMRVKKANEQMIRKQGKAYKKWVDGMAAALDKMKEK